MDKQKDTSDAEDCGAEVSIATLKASFEANLSRIDALLAHGQLKEASLFLSKAERLAITVTTRQAVIQRVLCFGTLAGHFDATEKLFREQLAQHPKDETWKDDYKIFRQIAGWSRPPVSIAFSLQVPLETHIHSGIKALLHSSNPLACLQSLAALSLQVEADLLLPMALAGWTDLESILGAVGERVLPYRLEAVLGEAWFAGPARGNYPRLPHLRSLMPEARNVPALSDVVAFLQVLESLSCRRVADALENLDTLMTGHSPWLWLRVLDLSLYFGTPSHWKKVCFWIQKQERQDGHLQSHPSLPAFAEVAVFASANDAPPLFTPTQLTLLNKQILQEQPSQVPLWTARPENNPIIADILTECITQESVPSVWIETTHPLLRAGLDFLRAIHREDVSALKTLWKQMPDALRQRPDLQQMVQQTAVTLIGDDAPQMTPDFWLEVLPLWKEADLASLIPVLDQLKPGPEKDWALTQCIKLGASAQPENCSQWLKKRWRDFSKAGWTNLKDLLINADPKWERELEEITLSPQTRDFLRDLNKNHKKKTFTGNELKNTLLSVPAKECLNSDVFTQFIYLLFPPKFQPTSLENWYSIHALREYWNRLEPDRRLSALASLEQQGHSILCRVLDEPLRPLLIDVANITLNAKIVGQGGGDPFATLERIWAAAWDQGLYPILTYADSSFWSNYRETEMAQKHFDRLVRDGQIHVADATGDHRRTADFHILAAIHDMNWQECASILTGDHYQKKSDPWSDMFPWLSGRYKKLKMEFEVSVTGQLVLTTSSKQRIEVP